MDDTRWLSRYAAMALLIVGGLEWLLGRTVSRMAASPALEGTPRDIVVTLGKIGLFLVSSSFLLASCLMLVGLYALGRRAARTSNREAVTLVSYLAIVVAVLFAYTLLPLADWLTIAFNLLLWIALLWVALRFAVLRSAPPFARTGVVFAALAYSGWYLYVMGQQVGLDTGLGEQIGIWAISLGELLAVLAPCVLCVAVALPLREWSHPRRWILPISLALVFAGGNIADAISNMGFTGVFTTWSLGLNITWPWPIYAVSLALYLYSVLTCFSTRPSGSYANLNTGTGLILLLLAGYNLQTSYQHLLALLALSLLTGLVMPFPERIPRRITAVVPSPVDLRPAAHEHSAQPH